MLVSVCAGFDVLSCQRGRDAEPKAAVDREQGSGRPAVADVACHRPARFQRMQQQRSDRSSPKF